MAVSAASNLTTGPSSLPWLAVTAGVAAAPVLVHLTAILRERVRELAKRSTFIAALGR